MTLSGSGNFDQPAAHSDSTKAIHDFDVYNARNEKIGQVVRAEMADTNRFSHLLVQLGSGSASRQVLLPLRNYRISPKGRRIDIEGWSREEVNQLPNYSIQAQPIQAQIEDRAALLETSTALESETALEDPIVTKIYPSTLNETTHSLQEIPTSTFTHNDTVRRPEASPKIVDEEIIPLLEERVIVDRQRRKSGEVVIRKVIETEIIEVVVRREKLIVEQVSPEYKELAVIDLGRTSIEESPLFHAKDKDL